MYNILKQIRSALRRQLGYVKRDLGYLEQFMSDGYAMTGKDIGLYLTTIRLYEQQPYMYDNRVHSVEHRIVSISQPWLRPIVRGKVKAPVEFGAKFDLSLDSEGYGRIESGTCSGRSDIPDQGKQELLQGTWNPVIRSKAGQAKRYSKS